MPIEVLHKDEHIELFVNEMRPKQSTTAQLARRLYLAPMGVESAS